MADLLLTEAQLEELTGYRRAADQLRELHRQGFVRARRNRLGAVVLERGHYEAVRAAAIPGQKPFDYTTIIPPQTFNANSAKRAIALKQRTPPWADAEAIEAIYAEARRLSAETGQPHHVDHEIPLQGALVSGLHVETNLRVLLGVDNVAKSNRFEEDGCS